MKIIPAILTNSKSTFNKLVDEADSVVDRIHTDFIDGEFADNLTIEPIDVEVTRYLGNFDAHLMVSSHNLDDWITEVINSGFEKIIVQVESLIGQVEMVSKIKRKGKSVGLALDLSTSISKINDESYELVDNILVMSVPAGFDNQKFQSQALEKVRDLKQIKDKRKLDFAISVDGGVGPDNVGSIKDAGADEVVVGKRIFTPDLKTNLDSFLESTKS